MLYIVNGGTMGSFDQSLYQSAFAKGEASVCVETIIRILVHRTGTVAPTVAERIRAVSNLELLKAWHEEALLAIDAEGARRLAEKIQKALEETKDLKVGTGTITMDKNHNPIKQAVILQNKDGDRVMVAKIMPEE